MKILTAQQIREADAYTIANEPISSTDLMERAATHCYDWIVEWLAENQQGKPAFHIVAGIGNNGGDGLVIARLLLQQGFEVQVWVAHFSDAPSADFTTNLDRLQRLEASISGLSADSDLPELPDNCIVIDALFGSGLTRPIAGWLGKLTSAINNCNAPIIAIDVPSGLFCEDNGANDVKTIVKATHTLTFEVPKLAFLFPENEQFVGFWHLLDIGLDKQFIAQSDSSNHFLTQGNVAPLLKHRARFSHKGSYGHALLMAGSHGKMGAAVLAARACLRSGVGLLTCRTPSAGVEILQTAVSEAMTWPDPSDGQLSELPKDLGAFSAIGIGPGIGQGSTTANMLKMLIQNAGKPMVLDADALNILAENKTWLSFLPQGSILTPHPKEFMRLAGSAANDYAHYKLVIEFARKHNAYVVLKRANTMIATPGGQVLFNSTGNPGMATGGSGDVLTGIITGLLAQGYSSLQACQLGVFLHGRAGDLAAGEKGMEALIAGDLVDHLGQAFLTLR